MSSLIKYPVSLPLPIEVPSCMNSEAPDYVIFHIFLLYHVSRNQDSSFGLETRLWIGLLRNWGSESSSAKKKLPHSVHVGSCAPVVIRDPFPGMKQHVRRSDHLPPSSAEIKNVWYYTSTPLYFFMICAELNYTTDLPFNLFLNVFSLCETASKTVLTDWPNCSLEAVLY